MLLPDVVLARRVDTVAVIGSALTAAAAGAGHRRAAEGGGPAGVDGSGLDTPVSGGGVAASRSFLGVGAPSGPELGPMGPAASQLADAVEAIGMAARTAALRPRPP